MAVDGTHQAPLPTDAASVEQSRSKRACSECSRKKSKCDMILPACSLCTKSSALCTYPTSRKPRAIQHRSSQQRRSAQQELRDKVDRLFTILDRRNETEDPELDRRQETYSPQDSSTANDTTNFDATNNTANFIHTENNGSELVSSRYGRELSQDMSSGHLSLGRSTIRRQLSSNKGLQDRMAGHGNGRQQQDTRSQRSTSTTYDTQNSNPLESTSSRSTHSSDPSETSPQEITGIPHDAQFPSYEISGFFGGFGFPLLDANTQNNAWQAPPQHQFGNSMNNNWNAENMDWSAFFPEINIVRAPDLEVTGQSPSRSTEALPEKLRGSDEVPGLGIPLSLVHELIDIYFDKIHSFLPLFHKPRFQDLDLSSDIQNDSGHDLLPLETSMILYGIFALSARFSSAPIFDGIPAAQRGDRFGQRAKSIYDDSIRTISQPTLKYLQGCILLAFYLYSCEPDSQGWLVIGACSRLAYDLGLNMVDEVDPTGCQAQSFSKLEWSKREELRRAWWCVWELDAFASAIACRPPTINRSQMQVSLPVSDQAWFADTPIESTIIDPDPLVAWHTLRESPNQDERAWFLVINFLLLCAHDLVQQRKPDSQQIQDMETAVACYALLLPQEFNLDSGSALFNADHFRRSNWIISTNIMLQGCQIFVRFLRESATRVTFSSSKNQLLAPLAAASQFGAHTMDYRPYAEQIFRTIRRWSPEYISFNSPFIGCLILGPAAMNIRVAKDLSRPAANGQGSSTSIEADLLKLTLGRIARFWKIGSVMLDLANLVDKADATAAANGG